MGQGNDEKAREVLARYHSDGDVDSHIVQLQMREMKEVIEVESGTDKRYLSSCTYWSNEEADAETGGGISVVLSAPDPTATASSW